MTPVTESTGGRSRFVSNTAALAASTVVSTVMTLVQVKILAAYLLPETFGSFAALRGFSLLISMLAANGLPQLLVRFLPVHESRRQLSLSLALSGACFFLALFLLTVFVFVVEANRPLFFEFLSASEPIGTGRSGSLFLWFYATTMGVTLKLVLYGGFNGLRRLSVQTILELASLIIQVAWIYLWREQLSLARLFMILGVTSLAASVVGLPWYFARLYRDVVPDGAKADNDGARVGYGGYWLGATGMSLVALAFTDVDRYVLSKVVALEVLSQFHIGARILRLTNRFLSVPVLAFQPEISRLDAERRSELVYSTTTVFFKFNTAVASAAAIVVAALAPELVRLVSNDRYDAAAPFLQLVAISVPLTAMTAPLTAVMKALDQVRAALYCDLTWAVAYIALSLQLGKWYGLTGVGTAQVVACLVQLLMALWLGRVKPGVGEVLPVAAKSLFAGVVAFCPIVLAGWLLPDPALALFAKAVLAIAGVVLFRIVLVKALRLFDPEERGALVSLMERAGLGALARRIV